MIFAQAFSRWSRLECRCFLSDGLVHVGGAASRCMLDNRSMAICRGTGRDAQAAPEMQALAQRFGFAFVAHAVGHANRSARLERPFHYIENNFCTGRSFERLDDLNAQLLAWCDQINGRFKRQVRAVPRDLFAIERPHLRPLPVHVPEVHDVHARRVDVEGYVSLHVACARWPGRWRNSSTCCAGATAVVPPVPSGISTARTSTIPPPWSWMPCGLRCGTRSAT